MLIFMVPDSTISEHAAQGGKARSSVLTPEERKAIARTDALARWGAREDKQASPPPDEQINQLKRQDKTEQDKTEKDGVATALFPGKLSIGGTEFSVYVLDNGKRVMAQREVMRVLTGHVKGGLGVYLESQSLRPYINPDEITRQTIQFKIPGTQYKGIGYEATLLLDICDAYLRAREANALAPNQHDLAKQAE